MVVTKTIEQTVTFNASPHDVYEALMDSEKHSQFTGAKASISREVGGTFTAYDGALSGTILELVPDAKIVQSWRGSDDGWVPGHYSTATFSLEAIDRGTRLTFVQTGVPEESVEQITQGWQTYYWPKMKQMLES
ncbi:MAG: SRPBCC domain-containing protein [Chloroflexi bacterium]|nr:SRPBCC domain-containing protein [Chloroflexota bacterium]MCI0787534.1 SRPBCC domain-containing protein [Chloroflexota bacterium]MCI0799883.1 SRPBCC domain-containing protein [Chloroflexota bacterium]MCI0824205.1 SRPBCC domain-containing protein [Chloroflexota bacterium]MCI0858690.1 SRPBCC domain-containing protein [Chloroflexota bacterium]